MLYIYLNNDGTKLATRSLKDIADLLKKDRGTVTRYLKTGIYNNNDVIIMKFEESDIRTVTRNRKGNQLYKLIPELKRQATGNNENYNEFTDI